MRQISKNINEPVSLTKHRSTPNSSYSNYESKDDLRDGLLKEQGYICSYCMKSIDKMNMKIEHFKPRSKYPKLQLDYQNMFGVCMGGEGKPKHLHHCDTSKAHQEITLNPANLEINCEEFIEYSDDGKIYSNDPRIDYELNNVLNLNLQSLTGARKATLKALKRWIEMDKTINLDQRLKDLVTKNEDGKYEPYCQISISYIQKQLDQLK